MDKKYNKTALLQAIKEHATKLPLEFVVGALLGGGIFLLSTRKSKIKSKSLRVVNSLAKTVAPLVIITLLERMAENQEKLRTTTELQKEN